MKYDAVPRQRLRLFESDLLERTTTISPRAFACTWLPILSATLWFAWGKANVPDALGLLLTGLLGWTLFEYIMHRFLFHWKAQSPVFRSVVFVTHGNHHVDPNDPHRNMMPPIISVPVSGAVWGILRLAIGPAGTFAFLGFAVGYVLYDIAHYACHQLPMRRGVLRHLRRHHIRHHHARVEGNYAITAIMWDWVFRTRIPAKGR